MSTFADLMGVTLTNITGLEPGSERVTFDSDTATWIMHHNQNCCESVAVEDVNGVVGDLIGAPIVAAVEVSHEAGSEGCPPPRGEFPNESFTWTFYRISTIKGTVVIRWYGESNGYYSEAVDFEKTR